MLAPRRWSAWSGAAATAAAAALRGVADAEPSPIVVASVVLLRLQRMLLLYSWVLLLLLRLLVCLGSERCFFRGECGLLSSKLGLLALQV